MKRSELLKTKEFWITKSQIDLYNLIENYMIENRINRKELAEELNVSKGYISQILNGDFDHKISKLVELSLAVGYAPNIVFEKIEQYIEDDMNGINQAPFYKRPINVILNYKESDNQQLDIEYDKDKTTEIYY